MNEAIRTAFDEIDTLKAEIARLENALHRYRAHPDYEYCESVTGRKQADLKGADLEEEGWEINVAMADGGFYRDDYTDTREWRRKKNNNP